MLLVLFGITIVARQKLATAAKPKAQSWEQ